MEQVKSNLETQLEQDAATEEKFEAARELVQKQVRVQKAFRAGTLTLDAYKKLPVALQRMYRSHFGVPLSPAERAAKQRGAAQKKRNNKLARKARKTNRRKGR